MHFLECREHSLEPHTPIISYSLDSTLAQRMGLPCYAHGVRRRTDEFLEEDGEENGEGDCKES